MKLNLGAGRVIFPAEPEDKGGDEALPYPVPCYEPGWVNIDKYPNPGINIALDLFKFPWINPEAWAIEPFKDNSVDYIYCSHIVEHIPHKAELTPGLPIYWADQYRLMIEHLDGFFVFFEECWRIMKPGALMCITAPFGLSVGGLIDPTHTRLIFPQTFIYLKPAADIAPFDYHLKCNFDRIGEMWSTYDPFWYPRIKEMDEDERGLTAFTYVNVVRNFRLNLRAVKD